MLIEHIARLGPKSGTPILTAEMSDAMVGALDVSLGADPNGSWFLTDHARTCSDGRSNAFAPGEYMMRAFSYVLGCLICIGSLPLPVAAQQASIADAIVAETTDFQIFCFTNQRCNAKEKVTKPQRAAAQRGLEELQKARNWLEGMGFDVATANMDPGTDGKKALRLQFDTATHERRCSAMPASACRMLSLLDKGRVILPVEYVDGLSDGGTLVHEYVHTLQPARDAQGVDWLNEMVATAIGSAWVRKRTGQNEVYEPKYSMVLDREFWDGNDDPGYGKWDYAISLGEKIGSQDGVAYLAQDRFIKAANHADLRSGNGMTLFYDKALVGDATFDKFFPDYVARFNNVQEDIAQQGRTGKYLYYGDIAKPSVAVPNMAAPFQITFDGEVVPFAAYPMLLSLKLPPPGDLAPAENIFMAEVEVTEVMDRSSLTLVREHRLAVEKHRDFIMIDGNSAPDELGFYRVVNTPAPDSTANTTFSLAVRTRPVAFEPPACFQAGKPSEMVADGLTGAPADNWRLKVNNGSAKGLVITPASAGKITVEVEIDSPITRGDVGIMPVAPTKTRVNLGTYDVGSDDCELPLAGHITASFNGKVGGMMPHLGGGLIEQGEAHWKAVLDIKTKAPSLDPNPFLDEEQIIFPNDESSFQLSGSFKYELCQTANRVCIRWVEETYRGTGPIAADGGDLDIFTKDGRVWLEAKLPVLTTWTEHVNEMVERTETFVQHWEIGCRSTGKWWSTRLMRGYAGHVLAMDAPLVGIWTSKNHDEIEFECTGQWAGPVETTGEYSSSMELQGRLKALTR